MASEIQVLVPDIGDFEEVEVVEVLVAKGDRVDAEDSLVSLESDKATMEIPSPRAGVVTEVRVRLGDRVSEGAVLLLLDTEAQNNERCFAFRICHRSIAFQFVQLVFFVVHGRCLS